LSGLACKEVFPGVVEVRQHRLTHVGGEVVDPGDLCAKEREFFFRDRPARRREGWVRSVDT
jgi:hypothetical protein